MRIQERVMTQQIYFPTGGAPDSAPSETLRNSTPNTLRTNRVPQYAVGTPEHSALVDAVRREFPEVFDSGTNCREAERS